ncbi:uncharacterized protein At2g39910 isoform X1 [Coffea eugenioides]|uniref:uncharacterized protein At2g39910 isoform X1 n=1 Tax=Coffea eugenioides TaxID=49369 RepID=UPI000F6140CE|nr:uncharacterized protein At2g39910 isoform X1 [Coffea eugenioides]
MSKSSALLQSLALLSESIGNELSEAHYTPPPQASNVSIKSLLFSLLTSNAEFSSETDVIKAKTRDFILCCGALASALDSAYDQLSWIPSSLSSTATSALKDLAVAYYDSFHGGDETVKIGGELELDLKFVPKEKRLVVEFMPQVLPLLKDKIKESSIGTADDISAASAGVPVAYAIVAAYQLRWLVTQVDYPYLGRLCALVIPSALTALDHWSPQVKGQGMLSFIHLAKNVNAAEIGWYEDVILDACCQNIASSEEIWQDVVEMSVLLVTFTQRSNPRSPWYEKLLNEMLNHLERQPRNVERRVVWLKHIEPLFNSVGLILLAHFRRIFPLFFRWMHADDDDTVLLVLKRIKTILRLTWVRSSPYTESSRLVDELVTLHREAALRVAREDIRTLILDILILIQQSRGSQFEALWNKHKEDPDLTAVRELFTRKDVALVQFSSSAA